MKIPITVALCLLLGTAPAVWGQTATSPNQPQFTIQVNSRVVLTDVTVTDKHGNPITGLTANDFQLLDDRKPQNLASFEEHRQKQAPQLIETSTTPGSFSNEYLQHPPPQVNALLFDVTTIKILDQMYLFQQMKQLVNSLPAGEPVAVFMRAGTVTVEMTSFTDDHEKLLTAISKAIPRLQHPQTWAASDLDTLRQVAMYMNQIPGRKNLIWFTSGSNLFLRPDAMSLAVDPAARREVYDLLESERIAIYPIDARGLTITFGSPAMTEAAQQMQMRRDAEATGGAAYVNTNGLALSAQHVLATDGNYYTLSYTPNNLKRDSKWHEVRVKLVNTHYELSYRHGYFDDGSKGSQPTIEPTTRTSLKAGGNKLQVLDDRGEPIVFNVRVAKAAPTAAPLPGDSPLRKRETRYIVEYDVPAKDVRAASVLGNIGTDEVGAAVLIYDRNGELVSRKLSKLTITVDEQKARTLPNGSLKFAHSLNLPPGTNHLYLLVWDMTGGRIGTVNASIDVNKPSS
jgi:VWFA-related protein